MNNTQGALHFNATIDFQEVRRGVEQTRRHLLGLGKSVQDETQTMDASFRRLGASIRRYFTATALVGFAQRLIQVRGEFQKTEIAFGTMLQSKEQAKVLMEQLTDLAAKTPFGLNEVSEGAKRLLAFQVPANEVVETLRRMGDISAGLGVPMGQLIHVYGQVKAQGKLMTNDLYQFMNAGIPILSELVKVTGAKSEASVKKMVTEGKIGFKEIQQVIQNMTNQGGIFFNLMEKQSDSLSGKVANLGDAFDQMLNKIGENNEGLLSDGIQALTWMVDHYEDLSRVILSLVTAYGTYKAVLIAVNTAQNISILTQTISRVVQLSRAIHGATTAQTLFNLATRANPYVLAATAIAGVVSALVYFTSGSKDAKQASESLTQSINDSIGATSKERTELDKLYQSATDATKGRKAQLEAVRNLKEIYPSYFKHLSNEVIMAGKAVNVYHQLRNAILDNARAKAISSELERRAEERLKKELELDQKIKDNAERIAQNKKNGRYKNEYRQRTDQYYNGTDVYRQEVKELQNFINERNELKRAGLKEDEALLNEKLKLDAKTEKLRKDQEARNNRPAPTDDDDDEKKKEKKTEPLRGINTERGLEQRIQKLDEEIKLTDVTSAKYTELNQKRTELQEKLNALRNPQSPAGSASFLQTQIQNIDKELDKLDPQKNPSKVQQLLTSRANFQRKLNETEKLIRAKSFDEELQELERQWKNRYLVEEHYGKETAKALYPDTAKYASYFDAIHAQYEDLNKKIQSQKGTKNAPTEEELNQWQKLRTILDELEGTKDPLTNFKENLDQSLEKLPHLFQQLEYLYQQRNALNNTQISKGYGAEINARINEKINEQKKLFNDLLKSQETYEEKRTALEQQHDALRKSRRYQNATEEDKKRLEKAMTQEMDALASSELLKSEKWLHAFEYLEYKSTQSLQKTRQELIKLRTEATKKGEVLSVKALTEGIEKLDRVLAQRNPLRAVVDGVKDYIKATKDLANAKTEQDKILAQGNKAQATASIAQGLGQTASIFQAVGDGVKSLWETFGDGDQATADLIENIVNIGSAALELGTSIAQGDIAGMIKGAIGLFTSLWKAFNGDQEKERNIKQWEQEVQKLKNAYDELDRSLRRSLGEDKDLNTRRMVSNLEQQRQALIRMRNEEASKKKTDPEKLAQIDKAIADTAHRIQDTLENFTKNILGTDALDMAEKLGDALTDAFLRGESAANALDKVTSDLFRNMVKNALKTQLLEAPMKNITEKMLRYMGYNKDGTGAFDGLTQREREDLRNDIRNATENYRNALHEYADLFGEQSQTAQGLKGDIRGITEKTANALEAQINAIRIVQAETKTLHQDHLQTARNALMHLQEIAFNTRPLLTIQKEITEINQKTKPSLAGL